MSFTYQIEANGYIAHVIGKEQGSLDAAGVTFNDLIADQHLHRPFGLLIDVRALSNVPTREEAYSLSKFARVGNNSAKHFTALVVKRGVQYGMARMIKVFSEMLGANVNVFTDDQSAQLWLLEQLKLAAESNSFDVKQ